MPERLLIKKIKLKKLEVILQVILINDILNLVELYKFLQEMGGVVL